MMKIKKAKDTKTSIVKRKLKFQDYKNSLKAGQIERKINYLRKKLMYKTVDLKEIKKKS